ncbi:hemicentin-1-like isoform X2 [Crassostrea angulata]|uniref:hemicentin-1-like isoform X2 n=1 Tax=Magallana angulata TaxID=2784310 RepID=UPI0022B0D70F|nr:hemicentin-1-like isoform X2 [Crassostrea angulata]
MNSLYAFILFGLLETGFVAARWSTWDAWGHCSVTCGTGIRYAHRTCSHHGSCSGSTTKTGHCYHHHCPPVNGYLTAWRHWGSCSATCEGTRKRTRLCHPPEHGGAPCPGSTVGYSECGALHCPVDGQLSDWGPWSHCSATCEGLKNRKRTCIPPQHGGAPCTGETNQTVKCGNEHCPGVTCPICNENLECTWNTTCHMSETCLVRNFQGYKFSTHCILKDDCAIMKLLPKTQERIICCDDESCLQTILGTGRLSEWGAWGQCNATCEGFKNRTRTCSPHKADDVPCIDVTQTAKCGTEHCSVDGDSLAWGDWSPCSVTCGNGTRVRSRACIPPKYGGLNCTEPLFEMNNCSQVPCPER